MSDLIPFNSGKLPAHLQSSRFKPTNDLVSGEGFPVISIKGKVFTRVSGDEKKLIHVPNDETEPARSLEVVVVNYNKNRSKVYYETVYTEGSDAKPTCYSNDGVGPAADATSPQAKKCATCPHNQWGSRITDSGSKGKACADSIRLAIAAPRLINDPMLLRVPATSIKALSQYQDLLFKRGVAIQQVVTKIGFDYSVAHPSLTFKPVAFLDEEQLDEVEGVFESDVAMTIIGTPVEGAAPAELAFETEQPKPAPKPVKKAKVAVEEDDDEEVEAPKPAPKPVKKAKVVVEEEDDEEVEAPKPVVKKKAAPVVEVDDDLEGALDDLIGDDDDFDA
jgi:hypothetical protein